MNNIEPKEILYKAKTIGTRTWIVGLLSKHDTDRITAPWTRDPTIIFNISGIEIDPYTLTEHVRDAYATDGSPIFCGDRLRVSWSEGHEYEGVVVYQDYSYHFRQINGQVLSDRYTELYKTLIPENKIEIIGSVLDD